MTARCEQHVGEPYPPRCAACDAAEIEAAADRLTAQLDATKATS